MNLRRTLAWVGGLAGAAVVVVVLVAIRMHDASAPSAPSLNVPSTFKSLRDSAGHVSHIHNANIACSACHDLERHGFEIPDEDLCDRCHGEGTENRIATIHAKSPLGQAAVDCQACHTFTIDSTFNEHNCLRCHAVELGSAKAIVTHDKARCVDCHSPHKEPSLVPKACTECHEDRNEVVHGGKRGGAMVCLDCHGVHDQKAEADRRCDGCHKPIVATAVFAGHDTCVTCHQPHEFTAKSARPCVACHEDKKALGANKVAKHRACESCHKNHDQRSPTEAACIGCHRKVKVKGHPVDSSGDACLGCHPAHPGGVAALVNNSANTSASTVGCPSCHTEATTMTSFHAATTVCADCHKPHAFGLRADDGKWCGSCHKEEQKQTQRVMLQGHAKCVDCHQKAAHQPKATPKACVDCHAAVRDTAPKGHDKCSTCHVTHSGDLVKGFACATCHSEQNKGPHTDVRGGCVSCHRPHGPRGRPTPPACTTCHAPAKLPGMHTAASHNKCVTCHNVHETKPTTTRGTCSSSNCHPQVLGKPVAQHEPTAVVCTGCHPFGAVGRVK